MLLATVALAGAGLAGCALPGPGAPDAVAGAGPDAAPVAARAAWLPTASASLDFCDRDARLSAERQDQWMRLAAEVRQTLVDSRGQSALISRSGMNLERFAIRYSHSGIVLRGEGGGWFVRQLYYDCDAGRPLLFDQGIAGFLMPASDASASAHVSLLFLPAESAAALARQALDRHIALRLLAARYSANAYPFSTRYQNCNQWVLELLAVSQGGLVDGADLRARAQAWLQHAGYAPEPVTIDSHWVKFAAPFVPLLHLDDHPDEDRYAMQVTTTLPASIEAFVQRDHPTARRVEFCLSRDRIVIREGWAPIPPACLPAGGDRIIELRNAAAPPVPAGS